MSTPIPEYLRVTSDYEEQYYECAAERNRVYKMTFEDAKNMLAEKYAETKANAKELLAEYRQCEANLHKIVKEIEEWVPPTPQHEALKNFALEQIDLSMNTYLYNYLEKELNEKLDISDDAVWKYINNMNASCEKNVGEAYEQWQKDLKRTAEKNTWMRQLLESLDNFEYADFDKDIER